MESPNNLSGIYFRFQNPESGRWENWCFEDLPEDKQKMYMEGRGEEWLKSMVLNLAKTLKNVGDQFGITAES